ncbi:MAG: hypothetical protein LBU44_09790 [Mediterranea sp.]|jgi:hypothetical protein|nr:hypothetical protein [Mediterranea sp.]
MDSKKIICLILLNITFLSCILFTYDGEEADYYAAWHLKNSTDSILTFHPRYEKGEVNRREICIDPKTTVEFEIFGSGRKIKFSGINTYINDSVSWIGKNNRIRIWRKSEKNHSGKQFFNESYWTESAETRENKPCTIWTFEVLPEDIEP